MTTSTPEDVLPAEKPRRPKPETVAEWDDAVRRWEDYSDANPARWPADVFGPPPTDPDTEVPLVILLAREIWRLETMNDWFHAVRHWRRDGSDPSHWPNDLGPLPTDDGFEGPVGAQVANGIIPPRLQRQAV